MSYIAALNGVSFRPKETKNVVRSLTIGDELTLEREPENEFDGNAVKVILSNEELGDTHLGYVEKDIAAEIAERLDNGEEYTCEVIGFLSDIKPNLEITFENDEVEDGPEGDEPDVAA